MSFVAVGVAGGVGIAKTVIGGISAHNAQKKIENLRTPTYTPNQAIGTYYQNALNRFNTGPYNSQMYQVAKNNANQTLGAGIGALQDRRSATGGVSALVAGTNNSLQRAGVQAEQQQTQNFGALGRATQMKAGDDRQAFNVNQMMPYQKQLALYGAKAQGGNAMENSGLQDINSAANTAMELQVAEKYGKNPSSAMQSGGWA
jgi:hypothetical protein